jgi:Na+/H+ antiporter NhaD/arsenite permease-like protein
MHHCHEALAGVEWDTLLFFAALFVVVEGVGELGTLPCFLHSQIPLCFSLDLLYFAIACFGSNV